MSTNATTIDALIHNLPPGLKGEIWLDPQSISSMAYSKFWNDEEIERGKPWHVIENGFDKMEEYVESMGFVRDLNACITRLQEKGKFVGGRGIDVAAGVLWLLPALFKTTNPEHVTCVEYSAHRLLKIGPEVLKKNDVPLDKVTLALGSFYDLKIPAGSTDFAVLCQAFHHADHPDLLLGQISRALKPDGVIIILGEDRVDWTLKNDVLHVVRYFALRVLPKVLHRGFLCSPYGLPRTVVARSEHLYPPDSIIGDHAYLRREYRRILGAHGFKAEILDRPGSRRLSLIAYRK